MVSQETLLFLKPDAVVRRYTGARVLNELTEGAEVKHYEVVEPGRDFLANEHYPQHEGRFFYDWLVDYVSASPLHLLVLEDDDLIEGVREQLGDTVPQEAAGDSLRGRYGIFGGLNVAHASDSPENAQTEIDRWQDVLDDDATDHADRLDEYIQTYLNYPMVDPVRYRELTRSYVDEQISEEEARDAFTFLLSKETDAPPTTVARLVDVMVANAELER